MKLSLSDEHAEALRELAVSLGGHLALISKPKAADIFVLKMKGLVREIRALYKQLAREGSPRYYENHELELILDNFYIIEGASIEIERDFARKEMRMALDTLSQFRQAEECYKEIEGELERKTDVGKITSRLAKEYGIIPTHFGLYLVDRLSDSGAGTRPLLKWLRLNLEKPGP